MELGKPRKDWKGKGLYLEIISIEDDFNSLKIDPIIINRVADRFSVGKTIEVINDLIRTHYESDELNSVPSCSKGCTTGKYNYDPVNPVICEVCETPVISIINEPLESQVWMEVPNGVAAFMHPQIYQLFSVYFRNTNFDLIEYLTVPTYNVPKIKGIKGGKQEIESLISEMETAGIKRGINYFHSNFDSVVEFLFVDNAKLFKYKFGNIDRSVAMCNKFLEFITKYRHCVFTRYLPCPSKLIMVSERGGTAEFIDPNMKDAFDAPKTIASLVTRPTKPSPNVLQAESMKVVKLMVSYYEGYHGKTSVGKTGMYRGQLGGTRSQYSGRAVIAPLSLNHRRDELWVPWKWAVTLFSVHLENKLSRLGYTPIETLCIIDEASVDYHPLIDELLQEIIAECPEGGYPVSMLRNPTLRRGSNQNFIITKVLTDPDDYAIHISVLAIKDPNGDFDGDALQVKLLVDNKEKRQFSRLHPSLNLMATDRPNRIGRHIIFHPEVISIVNNYLYHS